MPFSSLKTETCEHGIDTTTPARCAGCRIEREERAEREAMGEVVGMTAENRAERFGEIYGGARASGLSVSDALDMANGY